MGIFLNVFVLQQRAFALFSLHSGSRSKHFAAIGNVCFCIDYDYGSDCTGISIVCHSYLTYCEVFFISYNSLVNSYRMLIISICGCSSHLPSLIRSFSLAEKISRCFFQVVSYFSMGIQLYLVLFPFSPFQ